MKKAAILVRRLLRFPFGAPPIRLGSQAYKERVLERYEIPRKLLPLFSRALDLAMETVDPTVTSTDEPRLHQALSQMVERALAVFENLRLTGNITEKEELDLRLKLAAMTSCPNTDRLLRQALIINRDQPGISTEPIEAMVEPNIAFDVLLESEGGRHLIVTSMGTLLSIQNALLVWRACTWGEKVADPRTFFLEYSRQLLDGKLPQPVHVSDLEVFSETGRLWSLAKTFLFCHEMAHISLRAMGERFDDPHEEEFHADYVGYMFYNEVGMMLSPPFRDLYEKGIIQTAAMRGKLMRILGITGPLTNRLFAGPPSPGELAEERARLLKHPIIARLSPQEMQEAAANPTMMLLVPLLLFCIIECHERIRAERGKQPASETHPPAFARIAALMSHMPTPLRHNILSRLKEPLKLLFPEIAQRLPELIRVEPFS